MRVYSDIDEDRERVIVTFARDFTLRDIAEMVSTSAKARVLHFPLLADLRKAWFALAPGDAAGFQDLMKQLATKSRLGHAAVLVADAAAMATVELMGKLAGGHCDIKGFYAREEAEEWLGWQEGPAG